MPPYMIELPIEPPEYEDKPLGYCPECKEPLYEGTEVFVNDYGTILGCEHCTTSQYVEEVLG